MRDYIDIGSTPCEEDCAQLGQPDYAKKARSECNRFIDLIRRTLGPEPEGTRLAVKSNPHDFGAYLSVVCYFDTDSEEAEKYAFRCEGKAPVRWDDAPAAPSDGNEEELTRDQIAYLAELPKCDLCDKTAEYDARTRSGPWAYLCPEHWGSQTYGQLGTGYGQKLKVRS